MKGAIANAAAVAYLEHRLETAQRRLLFPGFVLAMIVGLCGMLGYAGGAYDWGAFEPPSGSARNNLGMAAISGFFFPFGLVFVPVFALHKLVRHMVFRSFLDEAWVRWDLEKDDSHAIVELFR